MFKLFLADIKMLFRNRQAIFWALFFPLMFTFVFGFFFGKDATAGTVAVINRSNTPIAENLVKALSDSNVFSINSSITDIEDARNSVRKSKIAAALVIPENFGALSPDAPKSLTIIENLANATTNQALEGFLSNFSAVLTYQVNKIPGPIFRIEKDLVNTKPLTYFDFVLTGILGLALMNVSIIGISINMAKYREDKVLKRLMTTPMKSWWFIVCEILSRLVLNIIQVSIILLIGKYVFDAHLYGSVLEIYLIALLGGILFQAVGFALSSFVKTADAAQGAAQAVALPMMFLGGVFFPIDGLPHWLYSIVQYLPVAPLLRMLRNVALEETSALSNPSNIIIILVWIVICLVVSSWRFRLSDE